MEEDIKVLEEFIEISKGIKESENNVFIENVVINKKQYIELIQAIENLIKGYKELEEENEVLEEVKKSLQKEKDKILKENANLRRTNKKLYELCQGTAMQEFINNECDYIPKSKVREKIEELDRIIEPKQNRHQFLCIEVNKVGSEKEIDNIAEELSMLDDELKELLIERRTYKQLLQEGDK